MRDRAGHAQYMRAWSAARTAAGGCVRCESKIVRGVYCGPCGDDAREASLKVRRSRNARGLCAICGREPMRSGRTAGEKCAANRRRG